MRKTKNGIVAWSEESITSMTSYRLPHHGNRSFAGVIDDTLSSYTGIMESAVRRSCWRTQCD
ncbi:hypothetical protein [Dialister invisus]|uniref:hypothetical protein n=1 Tax=Dialister invisus TaxID=218538 RepID=UPI00266EA60A|nr:hypothetical protein [Dialister invisus]